MRRAHGADVGRRKSGCACEECCQRYVVLYDAERLTSWTLDNNTRDREVALKVALEYIKNGDEVAMRSGYAATWAAPSTGKTHLLDAIVLSMQASDDYRFFVPLPVTFNGNMNEIELGVLGLLARVLHVYFVSVDGEQFAKVFRKVVDLVKSIGRLELLQLLEAVAHDVATARRLDVAQVMPVLLLDEIRFSGDVRQVCDAATESLASHRTIITSLDADALVTVGTTTTTAVNDRLLAQLIALCAGHLRSIEIGLAERAKMKRNDVSA
jgi:hypothetical protein